MADDFKNEANILMDWAKSNKDLPEDIPFIMLRRFAQWSAGNIEMAKIGIIESLKLRAKNENIFYKRDPISVETKKVFEIIDMFSLPNVTKENYKIHLYRLSDFDGNKFDFTESIKAYFMVMDTRLNSPDPGLRGMTHGDIPIFDMNGMSIKHVTKVVIGTARIFLKYIQEYNPARTKQVHIINCGTFLDTFMAILKPFMKEDLLKMMHFHQPNTTTLYEFVPLELLPNEYGGKAGLCADLKNEWIQRVEDQREFLMNADNFRLKSDINPNDNKGKYTALSID